MTDLAILPTAELSVEPPTVDLLLLAPDLKAFWPRQLTCARDALNSIASKTKGEHHAAWLLGWLAWLAVAAAWSATARFEVLGVNLTVRNARIELEKQENV